MIKDLNKYKRRPTKCFVNKSSSNIWREIMHSRQDNSEHYIFGHLKQLKTPFWTLIVCPTKHFHTVYIVMCREVFYALLIPPECPRISIKKHFADASAPLTAVAVISNNGLISSDWLPVIAIPLQEQSTRSFCN